MGNLSLRCQCPEAVEGIRGAGSRRSNRSITNRLRPLHGKHRYTGAHLSETVEDLRESLYWSGMFDDDLRES